MKRPPGIDFGPDVLWNAHPQWHWLELAGNPRFPDPLRIMFVAYGRHAANGHAQLNRGELVAYLVRPDGTMPTGQTTWNAIQKAIDFGYLNEGSKALCLIVGSDHSQLGIGDPEEPCRRDHRRRERSDLRPAKHGQKGQFDKRTSVTKPEVPSPNLGDHDRSSVADLGARNRSSTLNPSVSSPTPEQSRRDIA